jgi:peptidoglycan hydrolase-like protein with peptidoglycan-binding domain
MMTSIKTYLERVRRHPFARTRALEQELETVREAHARVSADLGSMRESIEHARDADAQRLVELQQQVKRFERERDQAHREVEQLERALSSAEQRQTSMANDVESLGAQLEAERDHARRQVEQLERALTDAEQRQESTRADVDALGADLEAERSNARRQIEQLERALAHAEQHLKSTETDMSLLRTRLEEERSSARVNIEHMEHALTEAEQRQKSTEAHLGLLESRIEEERGNMRRQVEQLERALVDAEQRQKSTQAHVGSLEAMLEEERTTHQSGIVATENFLARMQGEHETRLKLQSELTDTLQDVVLRLQGTMQFQRERPQTPLLRLVFMAVVLFATGALAAVLVLQSQRQESHELGVVRGDISDLRQLVKQHIEKQDALLGELSQARERQALAEQAPVREMPPSPAPAAQGAETPPPGTVAFEPDFRALQAGLITLGFDLGIAKPDGEPGIKTRQALQEFRQFYLPEDTARDDAVSEELAALILKSADRVRADAAHFHVGNDVLAAIRLGSIRTGVDFTFLMELARVESNFNPAARAPRSSATGLFQFKDQAWLEAIRTFGAEYGLKDDAERVKPIDDEDHEPQPIVRDPLQLEVLALRLNPRLSTLMAAENIKRNLQLLSGRTRQEPGRTELYLAHYLGPEGAVKFLKTLDEEPSAIAATIFPEQAARDPAVFRGEQQHPRTVAQVYRWFERKFNTARYDERTSG